MHKSRVIADLPSNDLNWFARKGFPPGEMGRLLALMQEIDHNGLADILTPLRQRSGNLPGRPDQGLSNKSEKARAGALLC